MSLPDVSDYQAPPAEPEGDVSNNGQAEPERTASTWTPIDLTPALDGDDVPAPTLWPRTDGLRLVYAGRVHWFQGESESCKSWAAQVVVAQVLGDGGNVLYIDFEDDERSVVGRLKALVVDREAIAERLTYLRPEEPLYDRSGRVTAGFIDLAAVLETGPYTLAVIDGCTEAMETEDLDMMSNSDIAKWLRRLPKRLAATDAAVIVIDHVVKARDNQGRYAIGGQHKLAGTTGAAYTFKIRRPLARAIVKEITAEVDVEVVKDRPGYVRGQCPDGKVGTLSLTSWPDGGITTALTPDGGQHDPPRMLVQRILSFLFTYDGSSKRRIEDEVEGNAGAIRFALLWMADEARHLIRVEKKGQSHLHWLTDAGRDHRAVDA